MGEDQDKERRSRIDRLIEKEGLSQRAFAEKLDYSYSSLNKIMIGVRKVPNSLPSKIVEVFPEVRIDWLLYGEGEMYQSDQHLADKTALREQMSQLPTKPRLPKNAEGNIEQYYKGKKRGLCKERPIIYNLSDYDFSLMLKTDRMTPKFEPGDELFFKETNYIKDDSLEPEWGEVFLLDTELGVRIKRIYPAKNKKGEDCIRCVSYNQQEYPDFLIPIRLIRAIYKYVGMLRIK